jgi:opacity protein-like surface antigen
MKKSLWAAMLIAAVGIVLPAKGQDETPKLEAYAGYDYVRFNVTSQSNGVTSSDSYNANGGGGQLAYNANKWLGVVGDLTGYVATSQGQPVAGVFSYLFGPRLSLRRGRMTPFAQLLFGGAFATAGIGHGIYANSFAMAAGGGLDIQISRNIAIRPVQAEYFMTTFPGNGFTDRQNNFRFSAGVVFSAR